MKTATVLTALLLSFIAAPVFAQCIESPLACNSAVTGSLTNADCIFFDGSFYDIWEFSGTAGITVTAELSSTAFDTYLVLIDPSGEAVDEDDDGGGGTNSSLTFTLNSSGTWTIIANSYDPEETGAYNLTLGCGTTTCTPPSITSQPQSLTFNPGNFPTLIVTATGTSRTYQWYEGTPSTGTALAGETFDSLTVSPSTTTSYYVVVTACGTSVTSNAATLSPTGCTTSISSVTTSADPVIAGRPFQLTANATTSSGTLEYFWLRETPGGEPEGLIGFGQTITVSQAATSNYGVLAFSTCGTSAIGLLTVTLNTGTCGTNTNQLCLNELRYRVMLSATTPAGVTAQGVALYQTNVFGYFSLPALTSNAGNPEVFVKVLGPVNGVPWIFYAGLTNLDYTITVFDTQTGQTFKTYRKAAPPAGSFQSFGDFDVAGNVSQQCSNVTITPGQITASPGTCFSTSSTLCLLDRFRVRMTAKDNPIRTNNTGSGVTLPINTNFGFFTVPELSNDATNIEAFVKMVDATALNAGYWVFLGGLTDFEYTVTVTDTETGRQKIYTKPAGSTCGWNDTAAF